MKPRKKALYVFSCIGSVLFWVVLWHILAEAVQKPLLLPTPHAVLLRLLELCGTLSFWDTVIRSILRILYGVLLAVLLAIPLSVLTSHFTLLRILFRPLLSVIRSTPVASFIVLILLWIGREEVPTIITLFIALPVVWQNLETAILSRDIKLLEMSTAFHVPLPRRILHFDIPAVLPSFRTSVETAIGLGWKAGVAAEILALPLRSIGREIYDANMNLESVDLFAWTITVVLLSLLIELAISSLIGLISKKKHEEIAERSDFDASSEV